MSDYDLEKLFKATNNPCVPAFQEVDGTLLGYRYNEIKDDINNLKVNDSDIWVSSFPKSGTTWTQEMVWLIANNLDYEGAVEPLDQRFPFLDIRMIFNIEELSKRNFERFENVSNSIKRIQYLDTNPRCIKTHLPWNLLPKSIRSKEKRPKIIYVMRNPKDACVSYYHHYKLLLFYEGTFDEFATLFLNDKVIFSSYWKNLESYWMQRNNSNVLIIKYEDMKSDLKSIVVKVAKFLNKTVPDSEMEKLLNHLSFRSMRQNPTTNFVSSNQGEFMRKGIVGDYKNHMSPELDKKFDKWMEKNNKFGIEF